MDIVTLEVHDVIKLCSTIYFHQLQAAQAAQQAAHHAAQQAAQHQQMAMKKEFDSDYSENEQPPEKKPMYENTDTLR